MGFDKNKNCYNIIIDKFTPSSPNHFEMEKYYAFYFCGKDFFTERELSRTYILAGETQLEELLQIAKEYEKNLKFRPQYGLIREVTWKPDGTPGINSPSCVNGEKFQAFIFKRANESVTGDGTIYSINGERIDLEFDRYQVEILEI